MSPKEEIERALTALREAVRVHGPAVVANRPKVDELVALLRRIDWGVRELQDFVEELKRKPG